MNPKYLCIKINERRGGRIDIRLPYILAKVGWGCLRLRMRGSQMPDIGALPEAERVRVLSEGITLSDRRDTVRVYCE